MNHHQIDAVPAISVVIPCFNEETNLVSLVDRVSGICDGVAPGDYEIVLINDGSRDASWAIITQLTENLHHIVGVNLARN